VTAAIEAMRDQRGVPWLEILLPDLRHGARVLRRSPAFTFVAILSLALGIGVNAAIFHLIDAVQLRSLPVVDAQQLVEVRADGPEAFGNYRLQYSPAWSSDVCRPYARRSSSLAAA